MSRATRQQSTMSTEGPGSRSKTTMVGESMSGARAIGAWTSRAAMLPTQAKVAISSITR